MWIGHARDCQAGAEEQSGGEADGDRSRPSTRIAHDEHHRPSLGGDGNDVLTGLGGANTLIGGPANDTLTGGAGIDPHFGGDGDDTMIWNPGDGSEPVDGEAGDDTFSCQRRRRR